MNRGDVYWVNFAPSIGSEIRKKRPAVIISNNLNNLYMSRVQVMPITSNINQIYPSEALVLIQNRQGKAVADQITTVDKSRIANFICTLNEVEIHSINKIIKLQLGI